MYLCEKIDLQKEIDSLIKKARLEKKENKKLFVKLKKMKGKPLDHKFNTLHDEVFEKIDCLECANCCKTTSPIFTNKDVDRIAKHLQMKPSEFEQKYLIRDDEYDLVLTESPCVFLAKDNKCRIYDVRPRACAEYPHTNRKKMHQILPLTLKNLEVCPAVSRIVDQIKSQ